MKAPHPKPAQALAAAADLLEQGQLVNRLSIAITAIAVAVLIVPVFPASEVLVPIAVLIALAGAVQLFFAIRVSFQAALFRRLAAEATAERLDLAAFDAAMIALHLAPAGSADRSIQKRFGAAKRQLYIQAMALAAQILLAIVGALAPMLVAV